MLKDNIFTKKASGIELALLYQVRRDIGYLFSPGFFQSPAESIGEGHVEVGDVAFNREKDNG